MESQITIVKNKNWLDYAQYIDTGFVHHTFLTSSFFFFLNYMFLKHPSPQEIKTVGNFLLMIKNGDSFWWLILHTGTSTNF